MSPIRDEKTIRERLEQLHGQLLQWGTPELRVFVITKDELRGLDPRTRVGAGGSRVQVAYKYQPANRPTA